MSVQTRQKRVIHLDGIGTIHQWGETEKPQVILLHGFMQSGSSWDVVAPILAEKYCVIAPDLLGHGESIEVQNNLSLDAYVENLHQLILMLQKQFSPENDDSKHTVFLVGYSMGGRIAASYAVRYPETIEALVLESAGLGPRDEEERVRHHEKTKRMITRLDASIAHDPEHPLDSFIDWWGGLGLFASQRELPAEIQRYVRNERLKNDPELLRQNLMQAGQHTMKDLRPALVNLNKPILYLVGDHDAAYNEIARSLMRAWSFDHSENQPFEYGSIQVDVVAVSGHNIHLEHPEEFARLLNGFFVRNAVCPAQRFQDILAEQAFS